MQYAITSAPQFIIVQGSDPADLETRLNEAIVALGQSFILNITLSGAGDGNQFVVLIEYTEDQEDIVEGTPLAAVSSSQQVCVIRCFAGSDEQSLLVAEAAAAARAPAPILSAPFLLVDTQVAGSSAGRRFMGIDIYGYSAVGAAVLSPSVIATKTGSTALVAATPLIVTFTDLEGNTDLFTLQGTDRAVRYGGSQGIIVALRAIASIAQTPAGPSTITLEIVQDPTGTPTNVGSMTGSVLTATSNEAISADGFASLQTASASLRDLGLRITGAAAGFVTAASLQIVPIG